MWTYEHTAMSTASPEALWDVWSDMASWPDWNGGIERIEVDGPFEVGTRFTMTPPGEEPIPMRLVEVIPGLSFSDEMDGGDFVVLTVHRLDPLADGTRITYRTEISGPAADDIGPELGPAITADFSEVVRALAAHAER